MAEQLDHLHATATCPAVTVQIATLAMHPTVLSLSFDVFSFDDQSDTGIAVSYDPAGHILAGPNDSDPHAILRTLAALVKDGLPSPDSLNMISELTSKS